MKADDLNAWQYFVCEQNDTLFFKGYGGAMEYWDTTKKQWVLVKGEDDPQPIGEVYIPDKAEYQKRTAN